MPMPNNGIHAAWKCMYDDIPACSHCGLGHHMRDIEKVMVQTKEN